MTDRRKAAAVAVMAVAILIGGCLLASAFPSHRVLLIAAGVSGYLFGGRRAMILWHSDEKVFERPRLGKPPRTAVASAVTAGLVLGAVGPFVAHGAKPRAGHRPVLDTRDARRESSAEELASSRAFPPFREPNRGTRRPPAHLPRS